MYTPTKTIHAKFLNLRYFQPNNNEGRMYIYLHIGRTIKDSLQILYTIQRCMYILTYHFMLKISIAFSELTPIYFYQNYPLAKPFMLASFIEALYFDDIHLSRHIYRNICMSCPYTYVTVCIVKLLFLNYLELLRVVSWCGIIHMKPKFTKTLID